MSKYQYELEKYYDDVVNRIKEGESLNTLCQMYNINYNAFYKKIKKETPEILNRKKSDILRKRWKENHPTSFKPTEDQIRKIIEMYRIEKTPAKQIASFFGTYQSKITKILKDKGVPKNNQGCYWNEDRRQKHRELCYNGIIGIHAQGDGSYRFTEIEKRFANWCVRNDIQFKRQFQITEGCHRYDFYILESNILVEIDGVYWHSPPEQIKKDKQFENEAIKEGFKVVRFNDDEIYKSKDKCFERLMSEL